MPAAAFLRGWIFLRSQIFVGVGAESLCAMLRAEEIRRAFVLDAAGRLLGFHGHSANRVKCHDLSFRLGVQLRASLGLAAANQGADVNYASRGHGSVILPSGFAHGVPARLQNAVSPMSAG